MHFQKYIFAAILLSTISEISGNVVLLCHQKNEIINHADGCEDHCGFKSYNEKHKSICVCKPEYARSKNGSCIPTKDCALECDNTEHFVLQSETKCGYKCMCRPNYYRKDETCVFCKHPELYIMERCIEFNKNECKCNKCDINSIMCNGECRQNHLNCINYNTKSCKCTVCAPGCKLREGKCFKECPKNEEYRSCGSVCPPSCDVPFQRDCKKKPCVPGCFCEKGFFRDLNSGQCVEKKDCSCSFNNTEFRLCGPKNPATCENPSVSDDESDCDDNRPGCYCIGNTVRNQETGQCIQQQQCTCKKPYEEYSCRTECELSCLEPEPQNCFSPCKYGCYCKQGYLRNEVGDCIEHGYCECPPNEVISDSGCKCRLGYERHPDFDYQCMKVDDNTCPNPNEEFREYKDGEIICPLTCANMNSHECENSYSSGCFCTNGHIRDDDSGLCVKPQECCKFVDEEYFEGDGTRERGCYCTNGAVRDPMSGLCKQPNAKRPCNKSDGECSSESNDNESNESSEY